MRCMYRYSVPVDDEPHSFSLCGDPEAVAELGDRMEFWAENDTSKPVHKRAFQVFATGQPLPKQAQYTGTVQRSPLGFVWHLYEIVKS